MSSRLIASIVCGLMAIASTTWSQTKPPAPKDPLPLATPGILEQLGGGRPNEREELKLSGEYRIGKGTRLGRLSVRAEMIPDWHVYSMTQKGGAGQPSQIVVAPSSDFKITRPFVPDRVSHV